MRNISDISFLSFSQEPDCSLIAGCSDRSLGEPNAHYERIAMSPILVDSSTIEHRAHSGAQALRRDGLLEEGDAGVQPAVLHDRTMCVARHVERFHGRPPGL